ncbi:MAG TPA: N-acetylneuraminate synthase [bacterium (Candidatus Stahlbacteria)]|nr:N-acetylneuraminate synthase [Candidatus Stahlbacteria bacterium]
MSCFIIAEAGVNHNGSEERALQLVDEAVSAGANAVKFQTFRAKNLVKKGAEKAAYQKKGTGDGDQYEMLKKLELSDSAHERLFKYCEDAGIEFMSTGFDEGSINLLINLGVKRLKIPSGELTNIPYISYIASKNLPIILSTGMGDMDEVSEAINTIKQVRDDSGFKEPLSKMLSILHCTSNYPTSLENVNLSAMKTMEKEFGLPVGYSDHTEGTLVSSAAVAMGAQVIEKHFTIDRNLPGPDHKASLEPHELKEMISNIRDIEKCMGNGKKIPTKTELEVRKVVRRSIVMAKVVPKGIALSISDLILLRPEGGIPPKYLENVIGKTVKHDMGKGDILQWGDLV